MQYTLKEFSNLLSFPTKLGMLIGVEYASLLFYLTRNGKDSFNANYPVLWNQKSIFKLIDLELVSIIGEDKYIINYDKLEEILTPKEFKLPEIKPTFTDNKFITKCDEWHRILKDKNRSKTRKEIYSLFEGKTLEQSLEVLQYAIDNKHVTLFFNEKYKGTSTGTDNSGRVRSGGGKNSGEKTDYKDSARKLR